MATGRTLLDTIWAEHVIVSRPGGEDLLWVDLNLLHEGGTCMAFHPLRRRPSTREHEKYRRALADMGLLKL